MNCVTILNRRWFRSTTSIWRVRWTLQNTRAKALSRRREKQMRAMPSTNRTWTRRLTTGSCPRKNKWRKCTRMNSIDKFKSRSTRRRTETCHKPRSNLTRMSSTPGNITMRQDSHWCLAKITHNQCINKVKAVSAQKWSKRLRLWGYKANSLRQPRNSLWVLMRNTDSRLRDFRSLVTKIWHQMRGICVFQEILAQPVWSSQNNRSTVTKTRMLPRDSITVKLLSQSCRVIRSRNKEAILAVLNSTSSLKRRWLPP